MDFYKKQRNRVISLMLAIVMVFTIVSPSISLAFEKNVLHESSMLSQKETTSIEIYTEEDLLNISKNLSGNYILMNDIELSKEIKTVIGSKETPFTGVLDGNGYVINNYKYYGNHPSAGLISYSSGVIKNLGFQDSEVEASGFKTREIGTIVGTNLGKIENCYVINSLISPPIFGKDTKSGLIAGDNTQGIIKNCYATGTGSKSGIAAGNIQGKNNYINCYYDSDVLKRVTVKPNGVVGKTTNEMKSEEFTTLLNENRGNNLKWYSSKFKYPSMKEVKFIPPSQDVIEANKKLINELRENISNGFSETTDPWSILAMVANDKKENLKNIDKFKAEAFRSIKTSTNTYTLERYIIALSALGIDAREFTNGDETINALSNLADNASDLINAMIFELVAYDSGEYDFPKNSKHSKEELINNILSKQTPDGGWAFRGNVAEVDMTAMAIQSLAPYYNAENGLSVGISQDTYEKVKIAVDKAVDLLGHMRLDDGSYSSSTNPSSLNSNSTSMVIVALSALGIDVQQDLRFVKHGKTPIDGLFKFMTNDKSGFGYMDNQYNEMSTEQGLRALVSYSKFIDSGNPYNIYKCNSGFLGSPEIPEVPEEPEEPGIPEVPEVPEQPEQPEIPEVPEQPETPISKTLKVGIYTDESAIYEGVEVEYRENDTPYTVLDRLLGDKVVTRGEGSSLYVESIDGLGEFDKGSMSGWVYAVNRIKPNLSANEYKLGDGDELIWHYTLDLGDDLKNSFEKFDSFSKNDEVEINKPPVINVGDIELSVGEIFDPITIVTASDTEDGDLTSNIVVVENTVDTSKPGNYTVTYEVSDSQGLKTTTTIKVLVKETATSVDKLIENTSKWVINNLVKPSYGDEWMILGLARGDVKVSSEIYETYYENLVKVVKEKKGVLHRSKYTEYSRVIITLTALGYDPTNVGGYNLVEKLYDYKNVSKQGINGTIFALIALDTKGYEIEGNANSRQMIIEGILNKQLKDGGFSLSGDVGEVDITAMSIQALAKYTDNNMVKLALDRAVSFLSSTQLPTGGFGSDEGENVESSAQVLVALDALNINVSDERFVKEGKTVLDAISRFELESGGFRHLLTQNTVNNMSTEQAFLSLISHNRVINGKIGIYDMSDVVLTETPDDSIVPEDPIAPEIPGNDNNQGNEGDTSNDNNNNDSNQESSSNSVDDIENSPSTGDNSTMLYISIMLVAMSLIILINRKRKVQ